MAGVPRPLTHEEIAEGLAKLPGWEQDGDVITRTYPIRYHAAVAAIVTIADRSRRVQHHADLDLRIDHLRASITTHEAGNRLTRADFDLAHRIDAIVGAHQALPLD
ncbi:4a-hydroxytetrahydrobiopterin dehydratase [Streptomyces xanthophaeus]|uniref:4a-hydroxytetrahydrobiopterin dehydratase n=1 Tax=Streptomyces xanthophaeus TaxID=67385 RepID=UPI0004CDBCAC|nr:4a-hydroxytetrahydrobiopterin dehydratase [Streptomyces xanthophaeus]